MTTPNNLKFLFLMEIFAGLARGSYLVCIGWTALIVSNDVARVGQIFIIAMLTNIIAGPLIGVMVDRHNRKHLIIIAHLLMALPLAVLALAFSADADLPILWLFAGVIVVNAARMLYQISHDGLIHANVNRADLVHVVARFRMTHLLGAALGTFLAGLIIERFSPSVGFLFSASMSVILIAPVAFVAGASPGARAAGLAGLAADIAGGFRIFLRNRSVRLIAILSAIALPVGQLSNAILSSFIRDDLGRGSGAFGFVDSAWPIGGMLAALVLSFGLRALSARHMEYVFGLLAGVATIVFSMTASVVALAIVHATMGFAVWLCRIVIDGRVLQSCRTENVGRTKVYVEMMFALSAMIMCFSPTLVKLPATSSYFLFWGGFMVLGTLAIFTWQVASRPAVQPR